MTDALPDLITDPEEAAKAAGLRYVRDDRPGLTRVQAGDGFRFLDKSGRTITDEATLERVKTLGIPPAWTRVWICPIPAGHIQATGRDAKGRKQYRYHPRWREMRDETKFGRMIAFGAALPEIRERVGHDMALQGLPRAKVLATIVFLLESTFIRVGNEEYARQNRSYGLTTLRRTHVAVEGSTLRFHFRGKSGKEHDISIRDRRVASIVKRCQDLPGQELFKYRDADGELQSVASDDVNLYLREISGQEFSAKDFRTWAGTVLAARALREAEECEPATPTKKNVVEAVKQVAVQLGNTPAVCRKCYVHPTVIESYLVGTLSSGLRAQGDELPSSPDCLTAEEAGLIRLLATHAAA